MKAIGFMDRFTRPLALAMLALLAAGCTSLTVPSIPGWPESLPSWPERREAAAGPRTLAVVWTPAILQQPGSTPTRGLGGLVTFYGADRGMPIKVEGQLTVYAYREPPGASEKIAPDVKYVFPADQLAAHYGKSALGHSYSIWVPWDQAGGPRQDITLTACFEPVEGELVMGASTRVVLEGPSKAPKREAGPVADAGRTDDRTPHSLPSRSATYALPSRPPPVAPQTRPQMTTTTLPLPRSGR